MPHPDPTNIDPVYKDVKKDAQYVPVPEKPAPKKTPKRSQANHKEPLNSHMGVSRAWRPKGRK